MNSKPAGVKEVIYKSRRAEIWALHDGGLVLALPQGDGHILEMLPGFSFSKSAADEANKLLMAEVAKMAVGA